MNKFKALIVILALVFNLCAQEAFDQGAQHDQQGDQQEQKVIESIDSIVLSSSSSSSSSVSSSSSNDFFRSSVQASQHYKKQIISFLQNNLTVKRSMIPVLLMMYWQRNKVGRCLRAITEILKLTNYEKGFLTVIGGVWTLAFIAKKDSRAVTDSSSSSSSLSNIDNSLLLESDSSDTDTDIDDNDDEQIVPQEIADIIRKALERNKLSPAQYAIKGGVNLYLELIGGQQPDDKSLDDAIKSANGRIDDAEENKKASELTNPTPELMQKLLKNWNVVDEDHYSVLPNLEDDASKYLQEDDTFGVFESFRKEIKKVHLFVLGDTIQDATHWFSVVVQKQDEKFDYCVMNSDSAYQLSPVMERLKNLIEIINLNIIRQNKKIREGKKVEDTIDFILSRIETFLNSDDFTTMSPAFQRNKHTSIVGVVDDLICVADLIIEKKLVLGQVIIDMYNNRIQGHGKILFKISKYLNTDNRDNMGQGKAGELEKKLVYVFGPNK